MNRKKSCKDAVYAAVTATIGPIPQEISAKQISTIKKLMAKELAEGKVDYVAANMSAGQLKRFADGIVDNWIRKDDRYPEALKKSEQKRLEKQYAKLYQ